MCCCRCAVCSHVKEIHGRGRWKAVSEFVGTRDALQVKNHARQYYRKLERDQSNENGDAESSAKKAAPGESLGRTAPSTAPHPLMSAAAKQKKKRQVPTKPRKGAGKTTPAPHLIPKPEPSVPGMSGEVTILHNVDDDEDEEIDIGDSEFPGVLCCDDRAHFRPDVAVIAASSSTVSNLDEEEKLASGRAVSPAADGYSSSSSSDDQLPVATHEVVRFCWAPSSHMHQFLDLSVVTPGEMSANREFFSGNPLKSSERYKKIRDYIVQCWLESKPKYVSKTQVRVGLKVCLLVCGGR